MTWASRIRMTLGVIVIVAIVGALTLLLNQRLAQATSDEATIHSGEYIVGTDYSGQVNSLNVEAGSQVEPGTVIATISSPVLQSHVADGLVNLSGSSVALNDDGLMVLRATVSGTVSRVEPQVGSFVTVGSVIAEIEVENTRFVEADLVLAPRDYARLVRGADASIILPDQTVLGGELASFTVDNDQSSARVSATVHSGDLAQTESPVTATGTPVIVSIDLQDEGVVATVQESFVNFMRKIGL